MHSSTKEHILENQIHVFTNETARFCRSGRDSQKLHCFNKSFIQSDSDIMFCRVIFVKFRKLEIETSWCDHEVMADSCCYNSVRKILSCF